MMRVLRNCDARMRKRAGYHPCNTGEVGIYPSSGLIIACDRILVIYLITAKMAESASNPFTTVSYMSPPPPLIAAHPRCSSILYIISNTLLDCIDERFFNQFDIITTKCRSDRHSCVGQVFLPLRCQ